MEAHAWVESPLQALGAVEAFAAGVLGDAATIHGRRGLEPVRRTLEELERIAVLPGLSFVRETDGVPAGGGPLAVGDALSGRAQRLMLRRGPQRLVLLDDGRATRIVLRALVSGAPLVRPQVRTGAARVALARLTTGRLRRRARAGTLTVFTAVELDDDMTTAVTGLGIELRRHSFEWLRCSPVADPPGTGVIVLGSALVANDLVQPGPYLDWVTSFAAGPAGGDGGVTYWAHRREDARTLEALRAADGVDVRLGDLPVELTLRGLAAGQVVHTLPSTAAHTLRLLSPQAQVIEHHVPASWWRPEADASVRRHLGGGTAGAAPSGTEDAVRPSSVRSLGRSS